MYCFKYVLLMLATFTCKIMFLLVQNKYYYFLNVPVLIFVETPCFVSMFVFVLHSPTPSRFFRPTKMGTEVKYNKSDPARPRPLSSLSLVGSVSVTARFY